MAKHVESGSAVTFSRRRFFRSSIMGLTGATLLAQANWRCAPAPEAERDPEDPVPVRPQIPIALQLYSLRRQAETDFPGVLEQVAEIGYDGVEFAGFHGFAAPDLRRILDDLGLRSAGSHLRLASLLGDEFERTVQFNQILGSEFLIVAGHAEQPRTSREDWLHFAEIFNEIAERLAPYGMKIGYHNFDVEFEPIEGELPWDIFFGATRSEVVIQLDTAAATRGGGEVLDLLRPYPGRAQTIHLEDYSPDGEVVLPGDGVVPFPELLELLDTVGGTRWYVIEQEEHPESYTPYESVRACLHRLKTFLGREA